MITRKWPTLTRVLPLWLCLASCLLVPGLAAADNWTTSTVDSSTGAGQYVSLAVDKTSKLHMSYLQGTSSYSVMYATGLPGSWVTPYSVASTTKGALAGTAIGVDASNLPHVTYYVGNNTNTGNLFTRYKSAPSSWASAVSLDANFTPANGSASSLFMYKGGAHISYYKGNALGFANYSGTSKTGATVDSSTSGTGLYNSTVVDSHGKFHIVYYDATGKSLMYAYATSVSGPWTKGPVAGMPQNAGGYCALGIDLQDNLHVSYLDANSSHVNYLTRSSAGVWSAPVDLGAGKAGFTSIAVDSGGFPHVSYYGSANALMHATSLGGSWSSETVPSDGGSTDYGRYSAIRLDGSDNIYIAYYDATNTRLKVALKQAPAIAVTPASLNFGSVNRLSSAPLTVTIANNGQGSLSIGSLTLSGSSAAEFSAGSCSTILPGNNCTVTVSLAPTAGGAKSATLTITSNDPYDPSIAVPLTGSSPWQITASVGNGGNGGSITPAGTVNVIQGGSQSFTVATAGAPFSLSDLQVDGGSTGALGTYTFTGVSADHTIQALFVSPIRLFGSPYIYFSSMQNAYDALASSGTIQVQSTAPAGENLLIDQPVAVTLQGGYGTNFASQTGSTSLHGITVSNGNLTPQGLILQ